MRREEDTWRQEGAGVIQDTLFSDSLKEARKRSIILTSYAVESLWTHSLYIWVTAKSLQSCPTLQPMDQSPPGSSVHGILDKNTRVGGHFLFQGNLPDPGIELLSLTSLALAGGFFTTRTTWEVPIVCLAGYYNIREGWVSVPYGTEILGSPLKRETDFCVFPSTH